MPDEDETAVAETEEIPAFDFNGNLSPELRKLAEKPVDPVLVEAERLAQETKEAIKDEAEAAKADDKIPAVAPSVPAAIAPDDSIPVADEALLAKAKELGISEEEAIQAGTPDVLEQVVMLTDRRLSEALKAQRAQAAPQAQPAQPAPRPIQPVVEPAPLQAPPQGVDQAILDAAENKDAQFTPLEVAMAKQEVVRQNTELQQAQFAQQQAVHNKNATEQAAIQYLDEWSVQLGDGHDDLFGKGGTAELMQAAPNSLEFQRRAELLRAREDLLGTYPNLTDSALKTRAFAMAFGDRAVRTAQDQVGAQVRKRARSVQQIPSGRSAGEPRDESWESTYERSVKRAYREAINQR